VSIAAYAAKQVKKFLNLPVSLVTNNLDLVPADVFENIIVSTDDSNQVKRFYNGTNEYKVSTWHNTTRSNCYDLSPYDETLVIDSDYIINSEFLSYCWKQPEDFLIYDKSLDLASWRDTNEFEYVSQFSVKFYWATVFFFRKTEKTKALFSLIDHIKTNWDYYRMLYQLSGTKFRNDYAFSIAISILGDYNFSKFPHKMLYVTDRDFVLGHNNTKMTFLVQKKGHNDQYTAVATENLDVHVMSKYSLLKVVGDTNE
jgi:hypothetical protein